MNEKVVGVFGANSFIGRNVIKALRSQSKRTIAVARRFSDDFTSFVGWDVERRIIDFRDEMDTYLALQGMTHVVQLINTSNPGVGNQKVVADIKENIVPHVGF